MNSLFVGCGYVGQKVAEREKLDGGFVQAIVKTRESVMKLAVHGISAYAVDLDKDKIPEFRISDTIIYWFVPPQPMGDKDLRLRKFLKFLLEVNQIPNRVVQISTTGVYGDCNGDWVLETRPVCPQSDRARRRVDAENSMRQWCLSLGIPLTILRVPGIYGLGKLPLERLYRQEPVLNPNLSPWSNRVHVEDLVTSCVFAARKENAKQVYNISDGSPSTMTDFFFQVADAAGISRPPTINPDEVKSKLSRGMLSYLSESKRIDNNLMREHLKVDILYPSLSEGLSSIFS